MKRIKTLLSISAVFAIVAISSSAFAEDVNWDVAPAAKALAAASSYSYDQTHLDAFASEAGADVIASAKALTAAKYYQYDASQLAAAVEDGAENLYFASEHQSAAIKKLVNHVASAAQIGKRG